MELYYAPSLYWRSFGAAQNFIRLHHSLWLFSPNPLSSLLSFHGHQTYTASEGCLTALAPLFSSISQVFYGTGMFHSKSLHVFPSVSSWKIWTDTCNKKNFLNNQYNKIHLQFLPHHYPTNGPLLSTTPFKHSLITSMCIALATAPIKSPVINLFIQQLFIEDLLCVRYRHWKQSNKQTIKKYPSFYETYILLGQTHNLKR